MGFNIADVLKDVPELDTGREQIEYIALALIDGDSGNFYSLSEIESLANNIATIGLQQPLRLRKHPTEEGRYLVVSGHRRREALMLLAKDEPERWSEVACIVQRDTVSPAMQQLRLIFANSDTRKMSSADISEQAVQVEKLLYQLKEEGHEFPGRMRDHVAQVVQVSKTKLARLKVIREKLDDIWQPAYKESKISESVAYALAQIPAEHQRYIFEGSKGTQFHHLYEWSVSKYAERLASLDNLKCKKHKGEECSNIAGKSRQAIKISVYWDYPCVKCCNTCKELASCKNACPKLEEKVKRLKSDAKEARQQEKLAQEEKDRPMIEYIQRVYARVGAIRNERGLSVEEIYKAANKYYWPAKDKEQQELEEGNAQFTTSTMLPLGPSFYHADAKGLCDLADVLNCSVDYLLCRTDVMEMAQAEQPTNEDVPNSGTGWQTGAPSSPGKYVVLIRYDADCSIVPEKMDWDGTEWTMFGSSLGFEDAKFFGWMPMIPEADEEQSPLNNSCKTGMSPTGHCGAAACCPEPADCCLNCDKDCNIRCSWAED